MPADFIHKHMQTIAGVRLKNGKAQCSKPPFFVSPKHAGVSSGSLFYFLILMSLCMKSKDSKKTARFRRFSDSKPGRTSVSCNVWFNAKTYSVWV